ncbi:MAG: MFS transporter [Actinomycetota bacterium]|nr:MFS transporter [Actinomycetota bacterium]
MAATQDPALSRTGLRRVLVVLCVTEVTSWGVLYYAFPVLAPSIAADTGWSISTITAAFSSGLVVSGLAGIPIGGWLDRWGPRSVMTIGSLCAVPAVVGIATATTLPWFFASWALAGAAMAGVLYPPAFAALTRWWGPRRLVALTAVTLLAGLASTIFAPLTAILVESSDWRQTYLTLAVVLAAITIPAHLIGLRGPWPAAEPAVIVAHDDPGAIARSREFLLLTLAVGIASFSVFAVVVNQVPLLIERGLSTTDAAWALGLGGLGQVVGRLAYRRIDAATTVRTHGLLILASSAITILLLAVLPGPALLLVLLAMIAGAGRGLFTLLQATAISNRWGTAHYGRLNGLLSAPALFAGALAPWAGAALAEVFGGYSTVFLVLALLLVISAAFYAGSVPSAPRESAGPGGVGA